MKAFFLLSGPLILFQIIGCGQITLGGAVGVNDPPPSGVIVAQGPLSGANGRAVSGTVSIYKTNCGASTCDFILRLQNLSAPNDVSLIIVATINGAISTVQPPLRSATGTQNYTFTGGTVDASWNQVALHPTGSPIGTNDYGTASLTAIAP